MSTLKQLTAKLENRTAVIGIVGLGYVGLPLMLSYTHGGFRVLGFDIDRLKVGKLNRGQSYIEHITAESIAHARAMNFEATNDFSRASDADALIICVPTPLTVNRQPDVSFILDAVDSLMPFVRRGQIIALESTTYPGTTDEELRPRLEARDFKIGEDVFLVYSPEREDPGNAHFHTSSIPKVCGGDTGACLQAGLALYSSVIDTVVPVSSTRVAELTKLLENIYRAVNIGFINEMKMLADTLEIDIHEVIRAAATKPFGFTAFYPGPGVGGHCIPVDPHYLTWKVRAAHTRFIELAAEINREMPHWVINKVIAALNERNTPIRDSKILVLGIAYKKDIDDIRESPAVTLMELLRDKGASVTYSDPHVPVFPGVDQHHFELESTPLTAESVASRDLLLLATDHSAFDYAFIQKHAKLIVDTRGVYLDPLPNIVRS